MKYFFIAIVLAVIALTVYLGVGEEDHTLYIQEVTELRKRKDRNFKNGQDSPLLPTDKEIFSGLVYYDVDPEFKVNARLEKNENMERLTLGASTGENLVYLKYGYAVFQLAGAEHRILLLQETGANSSPRLFLPFSDETSAYDTYGGGRYLDLDFDPRSKKITLDFNRAYAPYCAYNENYTCAIPPPENHLAVPILAGEKNWSKN